MIVVLACPVVSSEGSFTLTRIEQILDLKPIYHKRSMSGNCPSGPLPSPFPSRDTRIARAAPLSRVQGLSSIRVLVLGPTIVDILRTNDLKFSLDVWIKVLYKVEMIRQLLPLDQVVYTVLVSNIALPSDIRQRLSVGMDGS